MPSPFWQTRLKDQHDTSTHTPKTLVNLEIGSTRDQLEIKKPAEHRQDLQKQRESLKRQNFKRIKPEGARAKRAPP